MYDTTYYINDGGQIVCTYDDDGAFDNLYLWDPTNVDSLLADESSTGVLWALADHQNTVRDLVRLNGSIAVLANHQSFSSFGELIHSTSTLDADQSSFHYTGKLLDIVTGLQNNLHRWYDPSTGTWTTVDPIAFEAGDANLYRYVGNSPWNATDPDGLQRQQYGPQPQFQSPQRQVSPGFTRGCGGGVLRTDGGAFQMNPAMDLEAQQQSSHNYVTVPKSGTPEHAALMQYLEDPRDALDADQVGRSLPMGDMLVQYIAESLGGAMDVAEYFDAGNAINLGGAAIEFPFMIPGTPITVKIGITGTISLKNWYVNADGYPDAEIVAKISARATAQVGADVYPGKAKWRGPIHKSTKKLPAKKAEAIAKARKKFREDTQKYKDFMANKYPKKGLKAICPSDELSIGFHDNTQESQSNTQLSLTLGAEAKAGVYFLSAKSQANYTMLWDLTTNPIGAKYLGSKSGASAKGGIEEKTIGATVGVFIEGAATIKLGSVQSLVSSLR